MFFKRTRDSFLGIAEEFRLKGLTGTETTDIRKEPTKETKMPHKNVPVKSESKTPPNLEYQISTNPETTVLMKNDPTSTEMQDLKEQIRSVMTKTDVLSADGKGYVLFSCNICGKQAPQGNMSRHIEANHITGISHACDTCGKVSRCKDSLSKHNCACYQIPVTGLGLFLKDTYV